MDAKTCLILFLVLPFATCEWRQFHEDPRSLREARREIHYHSKRHMLPRETDRKRRTTTQRTKEIRKKVKKNVRLSLESRSHTTRNSRPTFSDILEQYNSRSTSTRSTTPTGHLRPLHEDDMENDEVVSVAIGPPATRPKYEKTWKPPQPSNTTGPTNFVKDVLVQLGREFLNHKVSEDFVFGQYVGNAMKNLTAELKLRMQHEILELIVKYQRINHGVTPVSLKSEPEVKNEEKRPVAVVNELKDKEKKPTGNETEEGWPDFSNLAKIVG